ncbi:MAG: hypothetical protein INQ03_15315 [Candidatus Heimdallarchaeota archaeon]|nr:hypothetical protein [Candidatus Heimdallarchaeota archaeon]
MDKLPLIVLHGSHREIGIQHGTHLKDRIHKTIEYYHGIFKKTEEEIFDAASIFKDKIKQFNEKYCEEIEAIAEAAEVNPMWIYALNSRTEILTQFVSECTAFYFTRSSLLVQNWDWAQPLEELFVMMQISYPSGHKILQITEPGIIGKIGINSVGMGVTLNFLHLDGKMSGLPIHITLRHFLDSTSINEAVETLGEFKYGKSSNIILADKQGRFINLEFARDRVYETTEGEYFMHTNHFLHDDALNTDIEKIASSLSRYTVAKRLLEHEDQSIDYAKSILADQSNTELPICRPYIPHEDIGSTGTISSIIMDLKAGQIHATPGSPLENSYKTFTLTS